MISHEFQQELCSLLNRHSIEGECSMPDFLLAEMLCGVIRAVGPKIKKTLDWHGTRSVCHPGPTACSAPDIGGGLPPTLEPQTQTPEN